MDAHDVRIRVRPLLAIVLRTIADDRGCEPEDLSYRVVSAVEDGMLAAVQLVCGSDSDRPTRPNHTDWLEDADTVVQLHGRKRNR